MPSIAKCYDSSSKTDLRFVHLLSLSSCNSFCPPLTSCTLALPNLFSPSCRIIVFRYRCIMLLLRPSYVLNSAYKTLHDLPSHSPGSSCLLWWVELHSSNKISNFEPPVRVTMTLIINTVCLCRFYSVKALMMKSPWIAHLGPETHDGWPYETKKSEILDKETWEEVTW